MDVSHLLPNPYEQLYIYYLEGTAGLLPSEEKNSNYIGNWEEDGFSFLFFSSYSDDRVDTIVSQNPELTLVDKYQMTCEEWHGDKIESYTSGNLCISPPWKIPFVNQPDIKHILLDPGVVFGTGRHPTTEDCLAYIEYLVSNETINTVLDIGTGTGLLSLAAAALGCKKIIALDFNLLAVRTTLNNVRLNSFENRIIPVQARGQDFIDVPADLVVANIHYDVMKDLVETQGFLDKSWFILSGLLKTETEKILACLEKKPVTIVDHSCPDGVWNTILGKIK